VTWLVQPRLVQALQAPGRAAPAPSSEFAYPHPRTPPPILSLLHAQPSFSAPPNPTVSLSIPHWAPGYSSVDTSPAPFYSSWHYSFASLLSLTFPSPPHPFRETGPPNRRFPPRGRTARMPPERKPHEERNGASRRTQHPPHHPTNRHPRIHPDGKPHTGGPALATPAGHPAANTSSCGVAATLRTSSAARGRRSQSPRRNRNSAGKAVLGPARNRCERTAGRSGPKGPPGRRTDRRSSGPPGERPGCPPSGGLPVFGEARPAGIPANRGHQVGRRGGGHNNRGGRRRRRLGLGWGTAGHVGLDEITGSFGPGRWPPRSSAGNSSSNFLGYS